MPDEPLVPARYIGTNRIHRNKLQGPGLDGTGRRRTSLLVEQGDILMMPAREILGQSYLFDPRGVNAPLDLGVGRRVLPEHAQLSERDLALSGYEFHSGRPDFELVVIEEPPTEDASPADAKTAKKGASQ
jgi:hypothetical protein